MIQRTFVRGPRAAGAGRWWRQVRVCVVGVELLAMRPLPKSVGCRRSRPRRASLVEERLALAGVLAGHVEVELDAEPGRVRHTDAPAVDDRAVPAGREVLPERD